MRTGTFKGKTALIVGGTSGMGKATAKQLLSLGTKVLVASKRKESVDSTVAELRGSGEAMGLQVDLADPKDVTRFIGALDAYKAIDFLVNASGIFRPKPFLESTVAEYNTFVDITQGFYFITQAVAKKMKENGGGAIVNIGSYWAETAVKSMPTSAYSVAKAGLHALTRHAAMELAEHNIRVNAIAPGIVETNVLNEIAGSADAAKEIYRGFHSMHPLGRNGNVDDVANAIVFLLSEESAWTTGVILPIDGGLSIGRS